MRSMWVGGAEGQSCVGSKLAVGVRGQALSGAVSSQARARLESRRIPSVEGRTAESV